MHLARTRSVTLDGVEGRMVHVEAHGADGVPGFVIVGLPDTACAQAANRVRAAAETSGKRITVRRWTINLSPATVRKTGAGFDLAIAVAALAADGVIDPALVHETVHLGELGLDGRLHPVVGMLPMVLAAARAGVRDVVVPAADAHEAALVAGPRIHPARSLAEVIERYRCLAAGQDPPEAELPPRVVPPAVAAPDLADVRGQGEARLVLEVAAAGHHHVLLVGPPGAGKTMLAERLPGLLPPLHAEESVEVSSVHSVLGELPPGGGLITVPPFVAPHHSATTPAMVGGGSGRIRPGAVSAAHRGVLFLDEAPEFRRDVLDSLRQSTESGQVTVARAQQRATYPAQYLLVLAANPCPCGLAVGKGTGCTCTPLARRGYLSRLSGPLLDRIDLRLAVPAVSRSQLAAPVGEGTAVVADRVARARERQARRLTGTPWRTNGDVPGSHLRGPLALPPAVVRDLDRAVDQGLLTVRGYDRVLRVAWTLADLAGLDRPGEAQVGTALALRTSATTAVAS